MLRGLAQLGGVTLDYGPFAFMERFQPLYNPWVGGGVPYAFGRQPQAAAINLNGLASAWVDLVERVGKAEGLSGREVSHSVGLTQSLSHSVTQSVTQSLSHSVTQSVSQSVSQSLSHSVTQSLSPTAQPLRHSQ